MKSASSLRWTSQKQETPVVFAAASKKLFRDQSCVMSQRAVMRYWYIYQVFGAPTSVCSPFMWKVQQSDILPGG